MLQTLEGEISLGPLFYAIPVVYLLLPATGRRFARAQGGKAAETVTPRAPGP